jgi:rubrerythrin
VAWISFASAEKQPHADCLFAGEWLLQQDASILQDLLSVAEDEMNRYQNMSGLVKKVWKCDRCGNSYNYKSSLIRHVRMECGQEPKYACPICMKMYTYKHVLKDHLQLVHKQRYEEKISATYVDQHGK